MKHVLLATAAVLVLGAPAFADDVTIEKNTITREAPAGTTTIEKKTITKETIREEEPVSGSTVSTTMVAPKAPPALRVETVPPPPRPNEVWMAGNWRWDPAATNFVWVEGRYAEPPRPRAAWLPGRWIERGNGWIFVEGRWD